ncbi:hypothetical protein DFJ58DRAFT_490657 [Suillus subalutaceus]|uniref:uncharacterized protein n=1 Tax=Suillus subalutaceus TaxID=48586 RepID=UPI001B85DB08|nr:uncharacterized protein DFJ58DRAFT_490657 [Suillus subalutaceus]KAG1846589.1 hypothetical protein DFJ58DRAFT_490657 [Suillus subalutaceus]
MSSSFLLFPCLRAGPSVIDSPEKKEDASGIPPFAGLWTDKLNKSAARTGVQLSLVSSSWSATTVPLECNEAHISSTPAQHGPNLSLSQFRPSNYCFTHVILALSPEVATVVHVLGPRAEIGMPRCLHPSLGRLSTPPFLSLPNMTQCGRLKRCLRSSCISTLRAMNSAMVSTEAYSIIIVYPVPTLKCSLYAWLAKAFPVYATSITKRNVL